MVMSSLWHGEPRQPEEVHHSGLSQSRQTCFCMAKFWKGHEGKQASTVVISESKMDVPSLLLREPRVEILLPQLQPSSRFGVSWWQRWQFCAETGSAGCILGISLGGVPQIARRQRVSRFGRDADPEDAAAKTEEQDRLNALDTNMVNLEKARGGKPSRGRLRWVRLSCFFCFLLLANVRHPWHLIRRF